MIAQYQIAWSDYDLVVLVELILNVFYLLFSDDRLILAYLVLLRSEADLALSSLTPRPLLLTIQQWAILLQICVQIIRLIISFRFEVFQFPRH